MLIDHKTGAEPPLPQSPAGVLVDPGWIAGRLGDPEVRVVEVDVSAVAYGLGHIPGAILWNAYRDLRRPDYAPIDAAQLGELLSRSGISPESTIVFYGYGAYLGYWLMARYQHESVLLMDGPRERWQEAGLDWGVEAPTRGRCRYELAAEDTTVIASREAMLDGIRREDVVILDVRSEAEFAGERFWPSGATQDAGRVGHIPGAVHLPFELVRAEHGALKTAWELRALFDAQGVTDDRRVISYCTIGNRASQVWFALRRVLKRDASVYYGSWVDWGRRQDTPIEA